MEADNSRRAAFKRTSMSVRAVAERIRADRHAAASLAATGTLGFAGSIGAFSSQGFSLSAKVSASQYSLGETAHPLCARAAADQSRHEWRVLSAEC